MVRLFFNRHSKLPCSIDHGSETPEINVAQVIGPFFKTEYHPTKDHKTDEPIFWIEFEDAEVIVKEDKAFIR